MSNEQSIGVSQILNPRWWRRRAVRLAKAILSFVRSYFPRTVLYEGSQGKMWIAGHEPFGPSIAAYFCGDDARTTSKGRVLGSRLPGKIMEMAHAEVLPVVALSHPHPALTEVAPQSIEVPAQVDVYAPLPSDIDALRAQLLTSTTKEDFRRLRKAGFSYRVTRDPDVVREFHARHYTPLVLQQYPEDGDIRSVGNMLRELEEGAELVCADIDGEWVAGILNFPHESMYLLRSLGIRDADESVRNKRVVSGLFVRSLERAVELGNDQAKLGRSLPFLGKGNVWFKAKWGGVVAPASGVRQWSMFIDLRNASIRQVLFRHPIIHIEGDLLVASTWLEAGEKALQTTVRETERFPGISRWYVFGEPETLETAASELSRSDRLVPVAVRPAGDRPIWLSEVAAEAQVQV